MKASTRNQTKGLLHQVKGGIKEGVGDLIDDPELEAEGKVEKVAGKVQEKYGKVAGKVEEKFEKVADKVGEKFDKAEKHLRK